MAEITYNDLLSQLSGMEKDQFEGVLGSSGFLGNYQKNPDSPLVTGHSNYEKFKPIAEAYQASETIPKGNFITNMFNFGSADAAIPDNQYGLTNTDIALQMYTPEQKALMFGDPNYGGKTQTNNFPFTSMAERAADSENFMKRFNSPEVPQGTDIYSMDESVYDVQDPWSSFYGNPELYQGFVERGEPLPVELQQNWLQKMLSGVADKAQGGWEFAEQLPGMAIGALSRIPGIGLGIGALRALARPDSPYQTFQKQTFADMGWQGDPNKDPWGKNIRSLADNYDVTEQWGDLMGTKLGQKYGYEQAFADGVLSDEELAEMQAKGLKGWQLNRAIGLSTAAKKAQDWKDKKEAEKILTNKMKNIDTGNQKVAPSWTPTGHYGKGQGTTGSWTPGGSYAAKSSPKGYSARSHSGGNYGPGRHHWFRGGRVGYANGGLAALFNRRG